LAGAASSGVGVLPGGSAVVALLAAGDRPVPDGARAPDPASFAALAAGLAARAAAGAGDADLLDAAGAFGAAFSPALAAALTGVLAAALVERVAPAGAFFAPRVGAALCDEPALRAVSVRAAGRRAGADDGFLEGVARLAGEPAEAALEVVLGPALPAAVDLFAVDLAVAFFEDRAAVRSERALAFFAAVTPTSSRTSPRGVRPAGRRSSWPRSVAVGGRPYRGPFPPAIPAEVPREHTGGRADTGRGPEPGACRGATGGSDGEDGAVAGRADGAPRAVAPGAVLARIARPGRSGRLVVLAVAARGRAGRTLRGRRALRP